MKEYTNSQMEHLIDEHVHSERNRLILKWHLIDGISFDRISQRKEVNITPRQIARVVSKEAAKLSKFL